MSNDPRARLLVVDDEEPIRRLCERSLSSLNCDVDMAADGSAAIALVREAEFDVVITDLRMPGPINGVRLLEEIKHCSPRTAVIIMTGHPALETAIPTLKQGACDYLIKPVDATDIRSIVFRCLETRRLSEELNQEKKLRSDLQAAYEQLQELERLKEAFLSRVQHELRTPLTPALMAIDLLTHASAGPDQRKLCGLLRSRLEHFQGIVNNLLLFSDMKDPSYEREKGRVNVQAMVEELVAFLKPQWEEKQLLVEMAWDPQAQWLRVNPELFQVALSNLLQNAIQFNAKGGRIRIQGRLGGKNVEISISDTGKGIPSSQISKVFDSFYQVASYLTREVGGLGLGLALVRRIAEIHGGSVLVESEEKRGSTFTFSLPVSVVENPASRASV